MIAKVANAYKYEGLPHGSNPELEEILARIRSIRDEGPAPFSGSRFSIWEPTTPESDSEDDSPDGVDSGIHDTVPDRPPSPSIPAQYRLGRETVGQASEPRKVKAQIAEMMSTAFGEMLGDTGESLGKV
jgi:hypothetical protein